MQLVFLKFREIIKRVLHRDVKPHWIRNFVMNSLKFSYKRSSSRSIKTKSVNSIYAQVIFSARLLSRIIENKLVINIDESSYSRSVKTNYSWLMRAQNNWIVNTLFLRKNYFNMRISLWWLMDFNEHRQDYNEWWFLHICIHIAKLHR